MDPFSGMIDQFKDTKDNYYYNRCCFNLRRIYRHHDKYDLSSQIRHHIRQSILRIYHGFFRSEIEIIHIEKSARKCILFKYMGGNHHRQQTAQNLRDAPAFPLKHENITHNDCKEIHQIEPCLITPFV